MKVLIIHPQDKTTDFLSNSYLTDATIIRTEIGDGLLKSLIRAHDVIIMMGHGTQDGLIGFGRLYIDSSFVDELRKKICVCVWCFASDFVRKYELRSPFSTGMFISEGEEAHLERVRYEENDIWESNQLFADALAMGFLGMYTAGRPIRQEVEETYNYGEENTPVILYNKEQFYSNI